jgi:hypothetical protein
MVAVAAAVAVFEVVGILSPVGGVAARGRGRDAVRVNRGQTPNVASVEGVTLRFGSDPG